MSYLSLLLLPGLAVPEVPEGDGTNTSACTLSPAQSRAKSAHSTAELLRGKAEDSGARLT